MTSQTLKLKKKSKKQKKTLEILYYLQKMNDPRSVRIVMFNLNACEENFKK